MKIRQIDFPNAILEAQRSGRLIVFAGAGVSMDPPSSYPDFNALASQVGGAQNPRQPGEAIDRYLGRLSAAGVTVHEQVRSILSNPESRPNANHKALVNAFRDTKELRIVTTNFDQHFTTTASERFADAMPEVFFAPALPIGNEFTGIVYLHGSVDKPANRLVLTDSDFGRAYITEGWATRFLERLFLQFVVLFVGYSHQDMLLTYLARGLTAGTAGPGRFSLTPLGDDARWQNLGIVPIHYPLSGPPEPPHKELQIALSAWAEQSQAGALAVEERIRSIVTVRVALTPEEEDYLKHAVSELTTLRFFTRYARGLEWLHWVEDLPVTQRLFTLIDRQSLEDWELASWLTNQFVIEHCDEMLGLVQRKGTQVSAVLWQAILHCLFREKVHGSILSKWLAVLLASACPNWRTDILEYVFSNCHYPEDLIAALVLFEHLTRPRSHLKESLRWSSADQEPEKSVTAEIEVDGSDYYLALVWNSFFLPNIDQVAKSLAPIVTSHLESARRLLNSFDKTSETWDPLNWSRGMIESRQQDHLRNGLSILIDAGAAVMNWALENDHAWASSVIYQWYLSESPLLRRLSIYGRGAAKHISADSKLTWLNESQLLYKVGYKHEIFLLMQNAYPNASVLARDTFLVEVVRQYKQDPESRAPEYELFNVVSWLVKSAPDCPLAEKLLAEIRQRNTNFVEREHPDMDSWIGSASYGDQQPPDDSLDMLSRNLEQILELLQGVTDSSQPSAPFGRSANQSIAQAVDKSHGWGINLARQAQEQRRWDQNFWQAIVEAWSVTEWTEGEWESVFTILESAEGAYGYCIEGLVNILHRGIQKATSPIPSKLIIPARAIADRLWVKAQGMETHISPEQIDWLGAAINHPAGRLCEFYMHSLSRLQREKMLTNELWAGYEAAFLNIVAEDTKGAQMARVILASQLHFLLYVDQAWTIEHILPLLDIRKDERRAKQCWHGFLRWGRWNDAILPNLLPLYERMFLFLDAEKEDSRRAFCEHLAGIAVYGSIDPLDNGWLLRFLSSVTLDTRAVWADQLRTSIQGLDDNAKVSLWRRWLQRYWNERLAGRPLAISPKESAEMLDWISDLGPVIPEAIELMCRTPFPELKNHMVYYPLAESKLLGQYPDAFADLLAFLTAGEKDRPIYDLTQLYETVERLVSLVPNNIRLPRLFDELARLGVSGVSSLVAKQKAAKEKADEHPNFGSL
jgi:SIR2-like protein/uncharacterized protein DUF4020